MNLPSRRQFLGATLTNISLLSGVGCGTVLHPERRGQPAGPLDWKIVALDAVGLLLFFVPGVIAFAVDFSNGTIYLPPDGYGEKRPDEDQEPLVAVHAADERLSVKGLEQIVSKHVRRDVYLVPGRYQTEGLESIDEFWTAADRLAAL